MKPTSELNLSGEIRLRRDVADGQDHPPRTDERRLKARISKPFPTRAWGTDIDGQPFDGDCELKNISSRGLYLVMPRPMKSRAELHVVVKFINSVTKGPTAVLLCEVLRDEIQGDGQHGVALAIKKHHFMEAQAG